jgi:hypothetical protein
MKDPTNERIDGRQPYCTTNFLQIANEAEGLSRSRRLVGDRDVNIWHSLWSWQHGTVCLTGFKWQSTFRFAEEWSRLREKRWQKCDRLRVLKLGRYIRPVPKGSGNFDPPSTLHWTLCPWYQPDSKGINVPAVDIYGLQPKSHSLSLKIEYYLNVPGHL